MAAVSMLSLSLGQRIKTSTDEARCTAAYLRAMRVDGRMTFLSDANRQGHLMLRKTAYRRMQLDSLTLH